MTFTESSEVILGSSIDDDERALNSLSLSAMTIMSPPTSVPKELISCIKCSILLEEILSGNVNNKSELSIVSSNI